jgi:hypothetical protein
MAFDNLVRWTSKGITAPRAARIELEVAARLYADAARNAPNLAERDHQTRQAVRLNQRLQHRS